MSLPIFYHWGTWSYLSEEHFNLLCILVDAQALASIRSGQDMVNPNVLLLSSDSFWAQPRPRLPDFKSWVKDRLELVRANLGASLGQSGP